MRIFFPSLTWLTSPTPEDSGVEHLDVSWTPEGLLLWKGRYVVPDYHDARSQVLENRHDRPMVGHPGTNKTLELVSRDYFWPAFVRMSRTLLRCATPVPGIRPGDMRLTEL
jgi:hypothetical protein